MAGWLNQGQVDARAKKRAADREKAAQGPYPGSGYGSLAAQNALARWLDQQKRARKQFSAAEQPLQQSVQMFQPGGGYGRGQAMLFRDEARRAGAEATSQQVASGMSSGSLSTGTGLRIKRDMATSLAGVEDVRTQFLNQALSNLSGLRGQQAGLTAQVNDPTYAPYMGYMTGITTSGIGAATQQTVAAGQQATQLKLGQMQQQTEMAKLKAAAQNKLGFKY